MNRSDRSAKSKPRTRRRVLGTAAIAASMGFVAGCGGPGGSEDGEPEAEEGTGDGQDRDDEVGNESDGEDGNETGDGNESEEGENLEGEEFGDEGSQQEGQDVSEAESWDEVEEILLGSDEEHVWIGQAPSLIEDEENPTLELTAGEEYDIGYVNRDGEGHSLTVWEGENQDQRVDSTDVDNEEGAEHWLTIEVTEETSAYQCEVHPDSMEGDIEVGGN